MLPVLSSSDMRTLDQRIIREIGLPSLVLMENAARGVIENIEDWRTDGANVLIYCGPGNNGGDGLAIARLLIERSISVQVVLPLADKLSEEAAIQRDVLQRILPKQHWLSLQDAAERSPSIVIDALLGTGSKPVTEGPIVDAVAQINKHKKNGAKIVAVDLPTGLDADTGSFDPEHAVLADLTVAIGAHKLGFYQRSGKSAAGDIRLTGLGYPLNDLAGEVKDKTLLLEQQDIVALLPKPNIIASKFSNGRVFALAGSRGMTGAAIMCATSALRAGCGLVNVAVPESERSLVAQAMPELLTVGCSETEEGYPSDDKYEVLEPHIEHADAIVIGPGLRKAKGATELMLRIMQVEKPMVIDAGAIAVLQGDPSPLKKRKSPTIITPHSGELSRLNGVEWGKVDEDRLRYAKEFAREHKVIVVSKGAPTYTIDTDGTAYINSTGNAGLATAGSGDVLAGVIAGTLVQMTDRALDAAMIGVYIHGLAGDLAADDNTQIAMTAMDVNRYLPQAYKALGCK